MIGRLSHARDFERLRRQGRRLRSGPVTVVALIDSELGDPRVAFAIRRAHGTAVVRNRTRRRLREVCRHLDRDGRVPPGWYLITPRDEAATLSTVELHRALDDVFCSLSSAADS